MLENFLKKACGSSMFSRPRTARRSTSVTPEGMQMTTRGPKNLLLPHTRLMTVSYTHLSLTIFPVVPVATSVCWLSTRQYAMQNCTINSFLESWAINEIGRAHV